VEKWWKTMWKDNEKMWVIWERKRAKRYKWKTKIGYKQLRWYFSTVLLSKKQYFYYLCKWWKKRSWKEKQRYWFSIQTTFKVSEKSQNNQWWFV